MACGKDSKESNAAYIGFKKCHEFCTCVSSSITTNPQKVIQIKCIYIYIYIYIERERERERDHIIAQKDCPP